MVTELTKVTGVILAGGQGKRMTGLDKGLVPYRQRPLVEYAIALLQPLTDQIVISANRNQAIYRGYGFTVTADGNSDFDGPLQGVLSAMRIADCPWVLVVPCDCPFLVPGILERLLSAAQQEGVRACIAHDGERLQPVVALLQCSLQDELAQFLKEGGRKPGLWYEQIAAEYVDCSEFSSCFINLNTFADLDAMEQDSSDQS